MSEMSLIFLKILYHYLLLLYIACKNLINKKINCMYQRNEFCKINLKTIRINYYKKLN